MSNGRRPAILEILEILESYESKAIRSASPERDVWLLEDPWFGFGGRKRVEECRNEILTVLLEDPGPLLIRHESPREHGLAGPWTEVSPSLWRFPEDFDSADRELASRLRPGGWLLCRVHDGAAPPTIPRSLFRLSPEEIAELVESRGLDLMIESFHDDNAWTVALARPRATE